MGGAALATSAVLSACTPNDKPVARKGEILDGQGEMTYRTNPNSGDHVSILGYGMMRLPVEGGGSGRENPNSEIDQEMVNQEIDYALEHGVNYFDTSPAYCKGKSEHATGIALSRHPRKSYYIATKLSNFSPTTWSREASINMFENSLKELQTDYIDYLLLHSIGGETQELNSEQLFYARFMDNGILDWLVEQKEKGRIRNLGFSYHGDVKIFDMLLKWHDEGRYHWDFVQIQMNYVDWVHPSGRNTRADYLYEELDKREIPIVIMEPLRGGALANVPADLVDRLKAREPQRSVASWAFRYVGSFPRVMCALSGMTYMEHLQDNLENFLDFQPLTDEEKQLLWDIADRMTNYPLVPCTACQYCMPCPYGINIPGIFKFYNDNVTAGTYVQSKEQEGYARARRKYLLAYDEAIPTVRQADHCIACRRCEPECPQNIRIPDQLRRIDKYIESLKRETL